MGKLLRLAVFILALGALAAGTGALLLQERHRERALELALADLEPAESGPIMEDARRRHVRAQRMILLFSGLGMVCLTVLAIVPVRASEPPHAVDRKKARSEMRGLETLARTANAQRVELDNEREARHRSEQDLHLQQVLTNHMLQDKIRLGRDLHDGIVQTLYATGLVLETATQRVDSAPEDGATVKKLIERAKTTLNAAIRQTRGLIGDLTPDAIEQQSLPDAINALLDHFDARARCEVELSIADDLPALPSSTRTELLQIIRESVSNALRHGSASVIRIRMIPAPPAGLSLVIRDNGIGFSPTSIPRGHGLNNLEARARSLHADFSIDSAPGHGTAVTLVLPAAPDQPTAATHPPTV